MKSAARYLEQHEDPERISYVALIYIILMLMYIIRLIIICLAYSVSLYFVLNNTNTCGMASEWLHSPVSGQVFLFSESVTIDILYII